MRIIMSRKRWNCFVVVVLICLQRIYGHGRMEEPPARNAAWRYGFTIPANYDDVGLNCGGLGVQKSNGGKCGICGDAYAGPRHHETGGKYATNIVVRHYLSGALIDVKILLSANHKGFMEFRLCPAENLNTEVTQECLNENQLYIEGYGTQYLVNEGMDSIFLRAQLPRGLSCSRCVLQWRYHAGNNWGRNIETEQPCLGCGPQEEFYNCADISIASQDKNIFLSNPTYPVIYTSTSTPPSLLLYPTSTTLPIDLIYPFRLSAESVVKNQTLRCYSTNEALKPLLGIENWCLQLCAINCPPSLCICVKI